MVSVSTEWSTDQPYSSSTTNLCCQLELLLLKLSRSDLVYWLLDSYYRRSID